MCLCLPTYLSSSPTTGDKAAKIPLQWYVFSEDADARRVDDVASSKEKGFALVAAESADSELRYNSELLTLMDHDQHPFARFADKLPAWTATSVLCSRSDGQKQMQKHNWGKCEIVPDLGLYFKDKVVVIGEHVESDKQSFPSKDIFGVDLQAQYIEALLSRSYKHEAPWILDGGLVLFVAAGSFLVDFLLYFTANPKLKEESEWVLLVANFLTFLISVGVSVLLLLGNFFTPIFFIAIPGIAIVLTINTVAFSIHFWAAKGNAKESVT